MDDWGYKPTTIDFWDDSFDYVVFLDENGNSNMSYVINKYDTLYWNDPNCFFNLTGVLFTKDDYIAIVHELMSIKQRFWPDGKYLYKKEQKRVCFHSREIRRKEGPFDIHVINYESFISQLSLALGNMKATIISSCVNEYKLFQFYGSNSKNPYSLAIEYMLERIIKCTKSSDRILLIFEARGTNEDRIVLSNVLSILHSGTYYFSKKSMARFTGVYFNEKWTSDHQKSYVGLEVADLCAYPIFKYCKLQKKDKAFLTIEPKLLDYPNYKGKGIKLFP